MSRITVIMHELLMWHLAAVNLSNDQLCIVYKVSHWREIQNQENHKSKRSFNIIVETTFMTNIVFKWLVSKAHE